MNCIAMSSSTAIKCVFLIDTGAQRNILPSYIVPDIKTTPTTVKVTAFGNPPIRVIGETTCSVTYRHTTLTENFIIVETAPNQVLRNCVSSWEHYANYLLLIYRMHFLSMIRLPIDDVKDLIGLYATKQIFSGTGQVKNFCHKVELDDSTRPVSCPPRKLPSVILTQVSEALEKLCSEGIIRKIEEPTDWCSALVVARRKSGEIRICTDLRNLNHAITRPVYPILDVLNIFSRINQCSVYSLLDCNNAFHQISVHSESQKLLIFATPTGRYCWQRLPYGIKSAPEIYQKMRAELLCNVPHCFVFLDDCTVLLPPVTL